MNLFIRAVVFCSAVFLVSGLAQADTDLRQALFTNADAAYKRALEVNADVLAPESFSTAMEHYRSAETKLSRGTDIETIRKELTQASKQFANATGATKVASVTLAAAFRARADASSAESAKYASKRWNSAESEFRKAAAYLEAGRLKSAEKEARDAEKSYRTAELEAIQTNLLSETRATLSKIEQSRYRGEVTKTWTNAKQLLSEAETMLQQNRYDTDSARVLARRANHEANHAKYLLGVVESVKKEEQTIEDVVLSWQTPLLTLGASMDTPVYFDDGYAKSTAQLVSKVEAMQKQSSDVKQQLANRTMQVASLEQQVTELETKLGGASKERLALAERLEQEAELKAKIEQIENLFSPQEAIVLRKGDDIIIRLVGLQFSSGDAVIQSERFAMLSKVESAINMFPGSKLILEGHTDSFGSDKTNKDLSTKRANSVKSYLTANTQLLDSDINAIGYGEDEPVANNETPEGRAKNRRIDLILKSTTTIPASSR